MVKSKEDIKREIIETERIILARSTFDPDKTGYLSRCNISGYIGNDAIILHLMKEVVKSHSGLTTLDYNPDIIFDLEVNTVIAQLLRIEHIPVNYRKEIRSFDEDKPISFLLKPGFNCTTEFHTPLSFSLKYGFDSVADGLIKHPEIDITLPYLEDKELPPIAAFWMDYKQKLLLKGVYLRLLQHKDLKLSSTDLDNIYETVMNHCAFSLNPGLLAKNIVESSMKAIEILQWLVDNDIFSEQLRLDAKCDIPKIKDMACKYIQEV